MWRYVGILLCVSIAVSIAVPYQIDFKFFYEAGRAVSNGENPYINSGFFNPIHVAFMFAPLSHIPFDLAWRLNAGLTFFVYGVAMRRLFGDGVRKIAMLAPFWLLITFYGNIDALILLGASLGSPWAVLLLIMKPQTGIIAAAIILWRNRHNAVLVITVVGLVLVSLAMGMVHGGLNTTSSIGIWPYGIVLGLPLMIIAYIRYDVPLALGSAVLLSPYCTPLNLSAGLPMFRANRFMMLVGAVLGWGLLLYWRSGF